MKTIVSASTIAYTVFPAAFAQQILEYPQPFWLLDHEQDYYRPLAYLEQQGVETKEDLPAWMEQNGYDTLKDLMEDETLYMAPSESPTHECGITDPTYESQPIPEEGIIKSTGYNLDGPCEVWLDDTMVMSGDNCREEYPGTTFEVDYSSCKDTCMLHWYWLGIEKRNDKYISWQIYKSCVHLDASMPKSKLEVEDEEKSGSSVVVEASAGSREMREEGFLASFCDYLPFCN